MLKSMILVFAVLLSSCATLFGPPPDCRATIEATLTEYNTKGLKLLQAGATTEGAQYGAFWDGKSETATVEMIVPPDTEVEELQRRKYEKVGNCLEPKHNKIWTIWRGQVALKS